MIQVDGHEIEEAFTSGGGHGVTGMVCVGPGIGSWCQATIGQKI